jgi:hypothetical protein
MTRPFTLPGLEALIEGYRSSGYSFRHFDDNVEKHHDIILRHDIDVELEAACQLSKLEESLGVSATYFVLVTSPLYNVLSSEGRRMVQDIARRGHQIGLHFDPTVTNESAASLEERLDQERSLLESILDVPVRSFSLHRPGRNTHLLAAGGAGMVNAYSPRFFHDIRYSSDAMGWWRYGDYQETEHFSSGESLQLVLHPIWWTGTDSEHPGDRLTRFVEEDSERILESLKATIRPFGPHIGRPENETLEWPSPTSVLRP